LTIEGNTSILEQHIQSKRFSIVSAVNSTKGTNKIKINSNFDTVTQESKMSVPMNFNKKKTEEEKEKENGIKGSFL